HPIPPVGAIDALVADGRLDARRPVEVAAGTNVFQVRYAALSFLAPDRVRFAYQLEGLDRGWIDAGAERAAFYSRVPPGRYRFRVRAANNDGVWNFADPPLT